MKWRAIILLVTVGGCAQPEQQSPIPDTFNSLGAWQAHASEQVRSWVPLGTEAADAQRIMEQHQFTTVTNCPGFFECYYRSPGSWNHPVLECIDVSFDFESGKVSGEQVATYLKGP